MSSPFGFSVNQLRIWRMRRDGSSLAEIARQLSVTKQAVSKAVKSIDDKVAQTLETTAKAAKIEVRYLDPKKGVLLGYSYETEDRVIVTFSTRHGVHIWHHHSNGCGGCQLLSTCRVVILDEAEERGIILTEEEKSKSPAEIARLIFSRVIPGLEP